MTPEWWEQLMRTARKHATIYRERAVIRAYPLPARAARHFGTAYVYVLMCSSRCACQWDD